MADKGAQIIADAFFIPDGSREQALHAIGPGLPGVFSDLPAIFSRDVTEDGLQVEQHVLADFGTSKAGTQTLMQAEQAQVPTTNLTQAWLGLLGYGMLVMLHAFLLSKRQLEQWDSCV